jgi:response regulator NasT
MTAQKSLCIAIVEEGRVRAAVLEARLGEAVLSEIHIVTDSFQLLRQIVELAPDVVVNDLEPPQGDVLDEMFSVSRAKSETPSF